MPVASLRRSYASRSAAHAMASALVLNVSDSRVPSTAISARRLSEYFLNDAMISPIWRNQGVNLA